MTEDLHGKRWKGILVAVDREVDDSNPVRLQRNERREYRKARAAMRRGLPYGVD
jgi:hypothetical protein